jgi:ketosteroid isomerase-like protein
MSPQDVEVVRSVCRALNARDVAGFAKLADPAAVWIPDSRTGEDRMRGRENVVRFFVEMAEMFDELRADPERFLETDDNKILVLLRVTGRGGASGAGFDIRIAHLRSVRGGVLVEGRGFGDRSEALEAAGLRE